jgi:hypothetical protein
VTREPTPNVATIDRGINSIDGYLRDFCNDVFRTLYRADQRRAGLTYLYGLLHCPGRKSIRRMAAATPGCHSEQSLQQFVNQSPWDHEPIRRRLMNLLVEAVRPRAWVIEEVAFLKHGRYSAAVERQYVRSLEKVCNCQLSIAVTLTADGFSVPVNWRLVLPNSWGRDEERRARAHVPEHERPRQYWEYQLEVLDDMALDWGMPLVPVVLDARHLANVEVLLSALDDRCLPYIAQVSANLRVGYAVDDARLAGGLPVAPRSLHPTPWTGAAVDLTGRLREPVRTTVTWPDDTRNYTLRSQFMQLGVRPTHSEHQVGRAGPALAERQMIVEWPFGKPQPRGFWVTNITDRPLAELVSLAKLRHQVGPHMEEFAEQFGLRDYEGRTFAGWHHHVTLATAAYVYQILREMERGTRFVPAAIAG